MRTFLLSAWPPAVVRFAIAAAFAMAVLPVADAHEFRTDTLHIVHPYTIEPAQSERTKAAVYMVIRNTSASDERLVSAKSPMAKSVTLETKAGPTSAGITLPAKAETTVGPQATFILMYGLTESLEGYQYIPMTLVFEHAGAVAIEVYVEAAGDKPSTQPK